MRLISVILVLGLLNQASGKEPTINLPPSLRQHNWVGNQNEGSCVHATTIMLFRYQRQYALADLWRKSYENGETFSGLTAKMEQHNIRWAGTFKENRVSFLEWAMRTRRGCMVTTMGGAHMILLVHLDKNVAGIIDNNSPEKVIWKSRQQFLAEWNESNSWALTPVYTPPPPLLRRPK